MMRRFALVGVIGLLLVTAVLLEPGADRAAAQSSRPAGTTFSGKAFRFNKVRDGIYHASAPARWPWSATRRSSSTTTTRSSSTTTSSPAAAWVLVEELKAITDKPVTTVINTHFHFDHAHGNQIFGPEVQIIGHEFTRRALLDNPLAMPLYQGYYRERDAGPDRDAEEASPRRRTRRPGPSCRRSCRRGEQLRLAEGAATDAAQRHADDAADAAPRRREIQIRYLGRGHTAGDVVVYLPGERVVITGDFLTSGLSNMSDSYPLEWVSSLEELKKLDFDTVVPGHGEAYTDKARIDYFQAYLRDVWTAVSGLKKQGVPAEEAAKRADLSKHKQRFPNPAVPLLAAQRIYELLDAAK